MTVSVAILLTIPVVAVMIGFCWIVTVRLVIGKDAVLLPARTVTVAGTVDALVSLLARVTIIPPTGAIPVRVTVPTLFCTPPFTTAGFRLSDEITGAFTVRLAALSTLL